MEVSFEPLQINSIPTMNKSCAIEDSSMYEECSICCESFTNKSFINECLHPFCYQCIIEWTKVKAACPLCIGPVTGILHNIRSQDDYDVEKVEPPRVDVLANINNDFIFDVDDTDTESSYGGMESMDMESDYDNSVIYENDDFDDVNYDNETGNFFDQLSNHEETDHDDAPAHSSEHEETEDEAEVEAEEDSSSSDHEDEDEEEDDEFEEVTNLYYNVGSDTDGEEHADDEYDCDSNDDDNDGETEDDNGNIYSDNTEDDDEDEPEHNFFDAEEDEENNSPDYDDMNETFEVSEDDYEEPDFDYNPTTTSDDEYYC